MTPEELEEVHQLFKFLEPEMKKRGYGIRHLQTNVFDHWKDGKPTGETGHQITIRLDTFFRD